MGLRRDGSPVDRIGQPVGGPARHAVPHVDGPANGVPAAMKRQKAGVITDGPELRAGSRDGPQERVGMGRDYQVHAVGNRPRPEVVGRNPGNPGRFRDEAKPILHAFARRREAFRQGRRRHGDDLMARVANGPEDHRTELLLTADDDSHFCRSPMYRNPWMARK